MNLIKILEMYDLEKIWIIFKAYFINISLILKKSVDITTAGTSFFL